MSDHELLQMGLDELDADMMLMPGSRFHSALRNHLAKPAIPPGYVTRHENDQRDIAILRSALETARQKEQGDTWIWAGDGQDHLESMGNQMTVVIRACELRRLIEQGVEAKQ